MLQLPGLVRSAPRCLSFTNASLLCMIPFRPPSPVVCVCLCVWTTHSSEVTKSLVRGSFVKPGHVPPAPQLLPLFPSLSCSCSGGLRK